MRRRSRSPRPLPLFLLAFAGVGAGSADAQRVEGVLFEAGTGRPIGGALVTLVTEDGGRVRGILTNSAGAFSFSPRGPGRYSVTAQNIGHETAESEPFELGRDTTVYLELEAEISPIALRGIEAAPDRVCRSLSETDAHLIASFWEEARKALELIRWTDEEADLTYRIRLYRRELEPDLEVKSESSEEREGSGAQPFRSQPADSLFLHGYVQGDDRTGRDYFAPDARALLSPTFLNSHCFRFEDGDMRDSVGLAFEPVAGRELPDIEGTVWLDAATLSLRSLAFRYANLDLGVPTDRLGGRVEFERLSNGAWVVSRWYIRMARITQFTFRRRVRRNLIGVDQVGGVLLSVTDAEGRIFR